MAGMHGKPIWFELTTPDMDGAAAFYGGLLGWEVADSGMEGLDYRIARAGEDMTAGFMAPQQPEQPTGWMIYIGVDDCDATIGKAKTAGGSVYFGPQSVPDVGRFAVIGDPQGAALGVMQPQAGSPDSTAWNQQSPGHGEWLELAARDHGALIGFYADLFGWTKDQEMPMGEAGVYTLFAHDGAAIGGMHDMMQGPAPFWLPYFSCGDIDKAVADVQRLGGAVLRAPTEVPGGAFILHLRDPQGCVVALVGTRG